MTFFNKKKSISSPIYDEVTVRNDEQLQLSESKVFFSVNTTFSLLSTVIHTYCQVDTKDILFILLCTCVQQNWKFSPRL